jgi:hypothetical protein
MSEKSASTSSGIQSLINYHKNKCAIFRIKTNDGKIYIGRVRLKNSGTTCVMEDDKNREIEVEEIDGYQVIEGMDLVVIISHLLGTLNEIDEKAPQETKEMIKVAIDRIQSKHFF